MVSFESEIEETRVICNDDDVDRHKISYVEVLLLVIYLVIFVFGLVGNGLVVYSVLRHKSKQRVTNAFMFNLAVANILLSLFVVLPNALISFAHSWLLGGFMCQLYPWVYHLVRVASMLILASIAVDFYQTVVHPLKEEIKKRKPIIIMTIIWLVSIATSLPYGIFSAAEVDTDNENKQTIHCYLNWPKSFISYHKYCLTIFVILLAIPLVVMASMYIASSIKMSRMSTTHGSTQRRTNRVLITMATVFCFCWMPSHILALLILVLKSDFHRADINISAAVFDVMAMSSKCLTPLFYVWLNKITIKQFCLVGPCFKHQPNNETDAEITAATYTVLGNNDRADDVTYNARREAVNLVSIERDG